MDADNDSDSDFDMYIAEIGNGGDRELGDLLNKAYHDFGKVDSLLYLRAHDTSAQRELVERLGIAWQTVYMPWLLVLEDHPDDVQKGDRALIFRLGHLDSADQVTEVTEKLMLASAEADAIRQLTWEKRKQKFKEMIPALQETADIVISVVGAL